MKKAFIFTTILLFFSIAVAVDSTYYYVKWNTGQMGVIDEIVEIYSDSAQTAPDGFEAQTKSQINALGYYTPEESFSMADEEDIDGGTTDAGGYSTWFTAQTISGTKYVYGGSKTTRGVLPGYNYLLCRNRCLTGGSPFTKLLYRSDSTWVRKWGWRHSWVCIRQYASIYTYQFAQDGWHHWGDVVDFRHSYKVKTY